jgi:hypothetical protein
MAAAKRTRVPRDTLPTQRIAHVVYLLTRHAGQKFTTVDLACRVHMQPKDVWDMLDKISADHAVPLTREADGWFIVPDEFPY